MVKYENLLILPDFNMKLFHVLLVVSMASAMPKEGRKAKAFSLFSVVTFPNLECQSQDPTMKGMCLTLEECSSRTGGSESGNCASGFGVCCLTMVDNAVTNTITTNTTYITNEGFPTTITPAAGSAAVTQTFTLDGGSDVKKIRLDFDTLITDQPVAGTGLCTNDIITITQGTGGSLGLNSGLCGVLTGQHIYIDGVNPATIRIQYNAAATTTNARSWKIFVRFLEDGCPSLPPAGCLQYFTGSSNIIRSLNHVTAAGAVGVILGNTRYSACVRMERGNRCILYREARQSAPAQTPQTPDAFNLAPLGDAMHNAACPDDVVQIGNTKYCGGAFTNVEVPAGVANNMNDVGSIVYDNGNGIIVVTSMANRIANSAFELRYTQSDIAC